MSQARKEHSPTGVRSIRENLFRKLLLKGAAFYERPREPKPSLLTESTETGDWSRGEGRKGEACEYRFMECVHCRRFSNCPSN